MDYFLIPEDPIVREMNDKQPGDFLVVGFIQNIGSTPATVSKKFHFGSTTAKGEDLQLIPPYLQIQEVQSEYQMIPKATEPAIAKVTESEMHKIRQGSRTLHLLGKSSTKTLSASSTRPVIACATIPEPPRGSNQIYPEGPPAYLKGT